MLPKNRRPTAPGEILLEEFLKPMQLTQVALAEKMGVPVQLVNTLINEKRGVTASTAIKLGRALETTPQFWMNLQTACDLWDAQEEERTAPRSIPSVQVKVPAARSPKPPAASTRGRSRAD
jgi:addiction module HigA family antidote